MKPTAAPARRLLDDREASARLSTSRSKFRELVAAGVIPRVRLPDGNGGIMRRLLVEAADLDRLIETWRRKDTTNERERR